MTETYTTLTGDPITTSTDEPTTTLHGDPTTTVGAPLDPCAGVVCRGSQVCNNGVCARPSSGSSDGGCSSNDDCRGSQVCTDGACGRPSSGSSSGSSDGGCSSDADCRGSQVCTNGACARPGRGALKSMNKMEAMAFDGEIEGLEAKKGNGFSFESWSDFQNATVSVSTVMMLVGAAMLVLMARSCFWKVYGVKKETVNGGQAMYGAV